MDGIGQLVQSPKQTINATWRGFCGTSSFCFGIPCFDGVDGSVTRLKRVGPFAWPCLGLPHRRAEALFHLIFAPYTVSWRCDLASFKAT